jgi:hypothetical protein
MMGVQKDQEMALHRRDNNVIATHENGLLRLHSVHLEDRPALVSIIHWHSNNKAAPAIIFQALMIFLFI